MMEAPSGPLMPVAIRKLTQYGLKILREAANDADAISQLVHAHKVYLDNQDSCRHTVYRDVNITDREQCTAKSSAREWRKPLAKDSGGFGDQYGVGATFKASGNWKTVKKASAL